MKVVLRELCAVFVLCFSSIGATANETDVRYELTTRIAGYFTNEQFAELQALADKFLATRETTPSGLEKIDLVNQAIQKAAPQAVVEKTFWDIQLGRADRYIAAYPEKSTPYIVKGIVLNQYAWSVRGQGHAVSVPKAAWKPFRQRMQETVDYLDSIKPKAADNPMWYPLMQNSLLAIEDDRARYMAVAQEGIDKFPDYMPIYFNAVQYLLPQWHNDPEAIEMIADKAVALNRAKTGMSMYARIYWVVFYSVGPSAMQRWPVAFWEKMKPGIRDVLKQHPGQWNTQHFAAVSCLMQDLAMIRETMPLVEDPIIGPAWFDAPLLFEMCGKAAKTGGPSQ